MIVKSNTNHKSLWTTTTVIVTFKQNQFKIHCSHDQVYKTYSKLQKYIYTNIKKCVDKKNLYFELSR